MNDINVRVPLAKLIELERKGISNSNQAYQLAANNVTRAVQKRIQSMIKRDFIIRQILNKEYNYGNTQNAKNRIVTNLTEKLNTISSASILNALKETHQIVYTAGGKKRVISRNSNNITNVIKNLQSRLNHMTNAQQRAELTQYILVLKAKINARTQSVPNKVPNKGPNNKVPNKVPNNKVNTRAIANKVWNRAWGGYLGIAGNYDYKKLANAILRNSNLLRITPAMKNEMNAYINTKRNAMQKHRAHGIVSRMI